MSTLEIPPAEWSEFFDSFSRRHDGWLVSLELLSRQLGAQIEVVNMPFRGISLAQSAPSDISLAFSDPGGRHLSHRITGLRRVWLKQAVDGADEALAIASDTGAVLLTFRSAMPTECVDGV